MHQKWMALALQEAQKAFERGEVPVGAVVVVEDEAVGTGHNLVETLQDPTAHAEVLAIQSAAARSGTWRLNDARIYVTLEPCPMCYSAIHLARIPEIVFGAHDPRLGACGSALDLRGLNAMTAPAKIEAGVMAEASRELMQRFFQTLRKK